MGQILHTMSQGDEDAMSSSSRAIKARRRKGVSSLSLRDELESTQLSIENLEKKKEDIEGELRFWE